MRNIKAFTLLALTITLAVAFTACKEKEQGKAKEAKEAKPAAMQAVDLSSNGIPAVVQAPAGSEVAKGMGNMEFDGVKTVNFVVKKDAFILDVSYTTGDEPTTVAELVKSAKETAQDDDFIEFVSEEEQGFIYKLKGDEGDDYSFYYCMLKDNNALEFGTGLNFSNYTLEQVQALYKAAKAAK